ncbi:MAG TPA: alpha/beta hydrolase, partial [Chloroflexota bacterium]
DIRVVLYDRRGYGDSLEAGPPTSLAHHVDDLLDLIGDEPAVVVAHSFGSHVAVKAAIACPDRFVALGLWEPPVPWMEFWPAQARRNLEALTAAIDPAEVGERVYRAMVGEDEWRRLPEELKMRRRSEGLAFTIDLAAELEAPYDWADLRVPVLLGYGTSTWPYSRDAAITLAGMLGAEVFTIDGAAHSAHVSHPEQFAGFVRRARSVSAHVDL